MGQETKRDCVISRNFSLNLNVSFWDFWFNIKLASVVTSGELCYHTRVMLKVGPLQQGAIYMGKK